MSIYEKIVKNKIVPVVKLDRVSDAVPLGKALLDGGLPIAEVTFRTDAAKESIEVMSKELPDLLVGAGTIINVEQARDAIDAGAKFLVSPGFSKEVVDFAKENNVPIFPGACTPTEIMEIIGAGLDIVKFFPAKQYGGLDTMKALAAPFPSIKFMPTGGINLSNVKEFLAFDKIIACGGSWMVPGDLINKGDFAEITKLTKAAVAHLE